jgi:hypothetical protein
MKMSPGEVMDRWTILRMKAAVAPEMSGELSRYAAEAQALVCRAVEEGSLLVLLGRVMSLMEANAKIWMLEAAIRQDKSCPDPHVSGGSLTLEEVGRRALAIRDHNSNRVAAKEGIDLMFGWTPDVKVDHASEAKDG